MNSKIVGILALCVFLEGSVTTVPLTLFSLIITYCFYKEDWIFVGAFFSGFVLDILLIRQVGTTSIFFLSSLVLIFFYQKKFEIASEYFVFLSLAIANLLYLFLFSQSDVFFSGISLACVGAVLFVILKRRSGVTSEQHLKI